MAESDRHQERELVLAPNEFAYILDRTKGNIEVFCGPHKSSLAATDSPVVFDEKTKRFRLTLQLDEARQTNKIAPEGWYLILKNPAKDDAHPKSGMRQGMPDLNAGQKVNIHGPCGFALWPGQMARVLQGHHIRSNQYLLVRVYDETAAKGNWSKSVIKGAEGEDAQRLLRTMPDLTMGKCLVISGTEASFYIPPTGVEVVPDQEGKLVRDAVTLERLEYCLLLDENGNKRYERGPAVVFPSPTEVFRTQDKKDTEGNPTGEKTRKFRAIELSPQAGIHVKVIADYTDEVGEHRAGDELFITGKETAIYFPREEHAIIKYGEQEVHYATAVPEGEARYVLHRHTGEVRLSKGPTMLLPDPRVEVLTRRVLDSKTCKYLYPDNAEALIYNEALHLSLTPTSGGSAPVALAMAATFETASNASYGASDVYGRGLIGTASVSLSDDATGRGLRGRVGKNFTGDVLQRKNQYTEPRTVTLNTKYQGAVTTSLWTGYAMLLVRKSGQRRVVQGPSTVLLEYDETPQVLTLSTGKPKTTDKLYSTVFLQTRANKIGDIIEAETKDFVKVSVKVSYRVNFTGDDPEKWFQVENYVKFLCDHLRSRVRTAVRKLTVEEFFTGSEDVLRDVILGGKKAEGTKRDGLMFSENNMHVYDVEILGVSVQDKDVERRLIESQRETINYNLNLLNARRNLEYTKETELLNREKTQAKFQTTQLDFVVKAEELKLRTQSDLDSLSSAYRVNEEKFAVTKAEEEAKNALNQLVLTRAKETLEHQIRTETASLDLKLKELSAEVEAVVRKAQAVSPDLISALDTFGERTTLQEAVKAMAPLSILGGGKRSVVDIVADLLKGTPLAAKLPSITVTNNGSSGNGRSDVPVTS